MHNALRKSCALTPPTPLRTEFRAPVVAAEPPALWNFFNLPGALGTARPTGLLCAFLILVALVSSLSVLASDSLERGFRNPPPEARPWVYWFIMDGNLSREGITADLEAMRRAGLGGVILMEVDLGVPRGPVKFMSPEWQDLFRHAVKEAQRLGLQITLNAGPGWTGSGGPWIKPEQSMQHLVASETNVTGPVHFEAVLPRPQPRKPFFGEGALPPDQEKARKEFYEDVIVLAFPTPPKPHVIPEIDEKALYLRAPYSSQPGVRPFLPAPAEHPSLPQESCVPAGKIVDLTRQLDRNGRLSWNVPEGNWTILRFARTSTGQNTRPAPLAGLGLESDKFDPKALDAHFSAFVDTLVKGLDRPNKKGSGWTMLHIDSWEMSSQNWSANFRDEFRRRRGYDLVRYLPVYTGRVVDNLETSERFLWDLRMTAQELVVEKHACHLKELGRRRGFGLSIEPYDMNPCADLTLGGVADVPMCEFWAKGLGFNTDFTCFEATSIAHTLGRRIVAAESFTAGDGERWQLYPGAMKGQGDWAFCTGINRIVFHRYQHQPWLDRFPGMTMGNIGSHWERTQTWWELVPAYHQYLARCQFMLRTGLPVADICYLVPQGAPHVFRAPKSATRGNPPDRPGYNFDACAPEVLLERMRVRNGRLVLPHGASYRVLVLPDFDTMTPALLRKIGQLVKSGAVVVGRPPSKSPSLTGFPDCDNEVKKLAGELWGNTTRGTEGQLNEHRVGKGKVVPLVRAEPAANLKPDEPMSIEIYPEYSRVAELLLRNGLPPDFEADQPLRYTHRTSGKNHIYFVSNPENRTLRALCRFRASGLQPELWNPVTGMQRALRDFAHTDGRTEIPLSFEPFESFFIVFLEATERNAARSANFPNYKPATEVAGPWEVEFQENRGAPRQLRFEKLLDWSNHPDAGVRHFSGLATYRAEFEWGGASSKTRTFLDLGEVRVMAAVRLNGRELGTAWTAPWRLDATRALKSGRNQLEITVANLWPNRLIGDSALPPEKRVTWTTWNPFTKDSALLPSGLLGPVRLALEEWPDGGDSSVNAGRGRLVPF